MDLLTELQTFPGREAGLRAITRYHMYSLMFYRSNNWMHARRVRWIARFLSRRMIECFGEFYDPMKAEAMALVHDDAELVIGDIQAGNKAKMNATELAEIAVREKHAIDEIAARFPSHLGAYRYRDLLTGVEKRLSLESQITQFADKFDAFGEAFHEIFTGNIAFATNVVNEYGTIDIPPVFYAHYFTNFADKFPRVGFLVGETLALPDPSTDWAALARQGVKPDAGMIREKHPSKPYELWKSILLANADDEEMENLLTVRETC